MANRTQIVCLCEGKKGGSIDEVFINRLIRCLNPSWIRQSQSGSNLLRIKSCGGRTQVINQMPLELKNCLAAGAETTLMVWADLDHDKADGDALKADFWKEAQRIGITRDQFDQTVFIFPKDRLENWIQFLQTGSTNECEEAPRIKHTKDVAKAAKELADRCKSGGTLSNLPSSLEWSCKNWRALVERMT